MTEARQLFNSLIEDLGTHMELGDNAKYVVKGKGFFMFQLESQGIC